MATTSRKITVAARDPQLEPSTPWWSSCIVRRRVTRGAQVGTEGCSAARHGCRAPAPGASHRQRERDGAQPHRQVRGIAAWSPPVANGDLDRLRLEGAREIATLVSTISDMIGRCHLRRSGDRGARDGRRGAPAATDGRRGGRLAHHQQRERAPATSPGRCAPSATWPPRHRATSRGDRREARRVPAQGQINQMIGRWRETRPTRAGPRRPDALHPHAAGSTACSFAVGALGAGAGGRLQHGAFFMAKRDGGERVPALRLRLQRAQTPANRSASAGMIRRRWRRSASRAERHVMVNSALGEAAFLNIVVVPILFESRSRASSSWPPSTFSPDPARLHRPAPRGAGIVVATIEATMRTDELLHQSQSMSEELQAAADQRGAGGERASSRCRRTGRAQESRVELATGSGDKAEKARPDLEVQVAVPRQHVARAAHAAQLAAHPVRQLSDSMEGNLSGKQVQFADTAPQSGPTCWPFINDSTWPRSRSGTIALNVEEVRVASSGVRGRRPPPRGGEGGCSARDRRGVPALSPTTCGCGRCCATCSQCGSSPRGRRHPARGQVEDRRACRRPAGRRPGGGSRSRHRLGTRSSTSSRGFQQADGGTSHKYGGSLGLSSAEIAPCSVAS